MTDPRRPLFFSACAAMFLFGIVLAVLGVLFGLPEMRARLGVTLVQEGDVFLSLFFGVFLSTIVVGPVIDSFGNKVVLAASSALVAIAFAALAAAHSFNAAMATTFLLGFGGGGLNTSANALVADLYPESRGGMLNVVATFYGFGAILLPLLAATMAALFPIPQMLRMSAALAAICATGYVFLRFPPPGKAVGFSLLASLRAVRYPGVLLLGLLLFCESGNEAGIGGWTSEYAGSAGLSPRMATWILAGYWAALILGRMSGAKLLGFMPKPRLVLAGALGSVAGSAILLAAGSVGMLGAGAVILGASYATIYPTTLAIAADRYQRLAGTIFGLLFAIGLCGGMLFPWLMGHLSHSASMRVAMTVPLGGAFVVCVLAVIQSRH